VRRSTYTFVVELFDAVRGFDVATSADLRQSLWNSKKRTRMGYNAHKLESQVTEYRVNGCAGGRAGRHTLLIDRHFVVADGPLCMHGRSALALIGIRRQPVSIQAWLDEP